MVSVLLAMDLVNRLQELKQKNARLREQVEQQEKELEELRKLKDNSSPINASMAETPSASIARLTPTAIPQLSLQPGFQPQSNNQYYLNDLLRYHDEQFVQNAYRAILKRRPEAEEHRYNLQSLRSGLFNKIDILAQLSFSAEGKDKGVRIKGLRLSSGVRQIGRLPILGYLVRLLVALVHLPTVTRNQQQFESYSLALLTDHINIVQWLGQGHGDLRRELGLWGAHLKKAEGEWEQRARSLEKNIQELRERMEKWGVK